MLVSGVFCICNQHVCWFELEFNYLESQHYIALHYISSHYYYYYYVRRKIHNDNDNSTNRHFDLLASYIKLLLLCSSLSTVVRKGGGFFYHLSIDLHRLQSLFSMYIVNQCWLCIHSSLETTVGPWLVLKR
jgi:hypothetical protein